MVCGTPKGDRGDTARGARKVTLDGGTVAVLRAWRARQNEERMAWGEAWTDSGFVFSKEDGAGYHPSYVSETFRRLVKATGLPTTRLHDLRHTAASVALVDARVPLVVLSKRLGHASVAITSNTYGHLLPGGDLEAAEAVRSAIPRKAS